MNARNYVRILQSHPEKNEVIRERSEGCKERKLLDCLYKT